MLWLLGIEATNLWSFTPVVQNHTAHFSCPASQVAEITSVGQCTWLIFVLLVQMGFQHIGQADLELLTSSDLPALASQSAGIIGINHHAQPILFH